MGKTVLAFFAAVFHPIHFILAGKNDMYKSSEEFEIQRDSTTDCGVICPLASEKNPHRLIMGKTVLPLFLSCFLPDPFYT